MAKRKNVARMRKLVNSTDRLFAALQRVDEKVDDFIIAKASTLETLEGQLDTYTADDDADSQSVN